MNRILISIIGLFLLHPVFSQREIRGRILDQMNSQAIPFVNVGIVNTIIGDLSDDKGFFKLLIPDSLKSGKVTFHTPGYERISIEIMQFSNATSTIYLGQSVKILEEVVVTKKGPKVQKMELTHREKIAQQSSLTLSQTKSGGAAVASLFTSPSESLWLDGVSIKINRNLTDSITVRIRILSQLDSGLPGEDLYPGSIVKSTIQKEGWWDINLEDYGIYIDEPSFFVCYELIEDEPTRMMMQQRSERKNRMMYDLFDKGVKDVQVRTDSTGQRIGWSSSLSKKETEKYGVDFPTGNTYFAISPSKDQTSFVRKSSFDRWKTLYGDRFGLVNGISISYLPNEGKKKQAAELTTISYTYPLVWGAHQIGFRSQTTSDTSRAYQAAFYEDGTSVPTGTPRPVQMNIWYPTNESGRTMKMNTYIRTLASAERQLSYTDEMDVALAKSLVDFGFTPGYINQGTRAQLDATNASGSFPLLVYIPGLSGDAMENYKLCEFLASSGYVVVAIASLGTKGREMDMDAKDIITQQADIAFAIKWAQQNLPVNNDIGIIGYSWGSMAGLYHSLESKKQIQTLISLDGSIYSYGAVLREVTPSSNLDETKLVAVSGKPLDRKTFVLYDELIGEKRFIELFNMSHDEFIAMGSDMVSINDPSAKERFSRLCNLVRQLVDDQFGAGQMDEIDQRFGREWE